MIGTDKPAVRQIGLTKGNQDLSLSGKPANPAASEFQALKSAPPLVRTHFQAHLAARRRKPSGRPGPKWFAYIRS